MLITSKHFQLYDDEHYKNVIEDRTDSLSQSYKIFFESKVNRAQSMHWNHDGVFGVICNVRLYDDNQCCGRKIADAEYDNWNLPAFSIDNKNTVNSYKIDCNE